MEILGLGETINPIITVQHGHASGTTLSTAKRPQQSPWIDQTTLVTVYCIIFDSSRHVPHYASD